MKKSAYAHSASIQKNQFCFRIACKECGYFNEVGRKLTFFSKMWTFLFKGGFFKYFFLLAILVKNYKIKYFPIRYFRHLQYEIKITE